MKPEAKHFTRDNPVTKVELWNCFRASATRFRKVQVDEAHAVIGKNAPRYLETKGYLVRETLKSVEYYHITDEGEEWLDSGIKSYVKNHPAERKLVQFFPGDPVVTSRVRRVRPGL